MALRIAGISTNFPRCNNAAAAFFRSRRPYFGDANRVIRARCLSARGSSSSSFNGGFVGGEAPTSSVMIIFGGTPGSSSSSCGGGGGAPFPAVRSMARNRSRSHFSFVQRGSASTTASAIIVGPGNGAGRRGGADFARGAGYKTLYNRSALYHVASAWCAISLRLGPYLHERVSLTSLS